MSGGHFNYAQCDLSEIADELEHIIIRNSEFTPETIAQFKTAAIFLRKTYVYVQRIDWLLSGDDSENGFHVRLKKDLERLNEF
jgi:hypothetical protein